MRLRSTEQRKAIFATLQGNESHPTAEEIYWSVKASLPRISLGTVYRNLKLLAAQGLIQEIPVSDGPNRYDFRVDEHHHFQCDRCGRVYDFEVPTTLNVQRKLQGDGFSVRTAHVFARGLCPTCAKAPATATRH